MPRASLNVTVGHRFAKRYAKQDHFRAGSVVLT